LNILNDDDRVLNEKEQIRPPHTTIFLLIIIIMMIIIMMLIMIIVMIIIMMIIMMIFTGNVELSESSASWIVEVFQVLLPQRACQK